MQSKYRKEVYDEQIMIFGHCPVSETPPAWNSKLLIIYFINIFLHSRYYSS
jgi:hypothetical protein